MEVNIMDYIGFRFLLAGREGWGLGFRRNGKDNEK